MLENEHVSIVDQQPNICQNFVSTTTDNTIQLPNNFRPHTEDTAAPINGDGIQSSKMVSSLQSSYYLSRMLDSSSLHKKIIRDALHSLIIENTRLNLVSVESQQALMYQGEVRALDMNSTKAVMVPTTLHRTSEYY